MPRLICRALLALFIGCGDAGGSNREAGFPATAGGTASPPDDTGPLTTPDDAGATDKAPDTGTGSRTATDDCIIPVTAPVSIPTVTAAPQDVCTKEQTQDISVKLATGLVNHVSNMEITDWETANGECASCVFTTEDAPRGPLHTANGEGLLNSEGCLALRTNPECAAKILDRNDCEVIACSTCEDKPACWDVAERGDCAHAGEAVEAACQGFELHKIGVGCIPQEYTVAGLTKLVASIVHAFCGPKP